MADILEKYDSERHLYLGFVEKVQQILLVILNDSGINFHSITNRVKDRKSLEKKIIRNDYKYKELEEITDIGGIRITTYFQDDVKKVSELLEREFEIDFENSLDKGTLLDPDRFGYLSIHHVIKMNHVRCGLKEYRAYAGLKLEIQTRSILQHAWAEIEHDLGYKSQGGVPKEIRRRFSRLAGLLELADEEFTKIRNELDIYTAYVTEQIKKEPNVVAIDLVSLRAFVLGSKLVEHADLEICKTIKVDRRISPEYMDDKDIDVLSFFNINNIHELEKEFEKNYNEIIKFANLWLSERWTYMMQDEVELSSGVSIFYMYYVLAAKRGSVQFYVDTYFSGMNHENEDFVSAISDTYDRCCRLDGGTD